VNTVAHHRIGDRSHPEFCGHAKSLDRRARRPRWADRIVELIGGRAAARVPTTTQSSAKEFTRARPLRVPVCRNVLLTPRASAKEVRQFGFDTSGCDAAYGVGDALGVYVSNASTVVDAWLIGRNGVDVVEEFAVPRSFRSVRGAHRGFSRDQAQRVYVQHGMTDYGADVWRWLQDGAHFYVCGDAARMAKDVEAALTVIIRTHGGLSDAAAHDYRRELVATKRYVRDVY
jgi:sulfite reductase alpha subunit-like flavoprotein